ncbi:MAG: SprT-like domain-containing protein [Akkermansiaceae bacterium]
MDLKEAFNLLQEEMGAHGLIDLGWIGKMDSAKKRFGLCNMGSREISLSGPLTILNTDDEVRDTILHEIAHALAWELHKENCGHDERWKAICGHIGARPDRTYDEDVVQPDFPWALYHVETGEIFATYQHKPSSDPSQMWWRGRKEETYGKLSYGLNPKVYPLGKVVKFDRNLVREFQVEVQEAVRKIAMKWGIQTGKSKGRFTDENFDLRLSFTPGEVDEKEPQEKEFEKYAGLFDLSGSDYRRSFLSGGDMYFLVALKPRNRKYPVIGENQNGTCYKFPRNVLADLR